MSRALLLAALLLSTGCYTTKMVVGDPEGPRGESHHEWQQTFFWGLISVGKVNAYKICGAPGVQSVKSQMGGIGLLAYAITAGIWTPMHVKVTCAAERPEV